VGVEAVCRAGEGPQPGPEQHKASVTGSQQRDLAGDRARRARLILVHKSEEGVRHEAFPLLSNVLFGGSI
jgi:hypothetical protein